MVSSHGEAGFKVWIKPVVSFQMTPNANHVSGFVKYSSVLLGFSPCSFVLYGALH